MVLDNPLIVMRALRRRSAIFARMLTLLLQTFHARVPDDGRLQGNSFDITICERPPKYARAVRWKKKSQLVLRVCGLIFFLERGFVLCGKTSRHFLSRKEFMTVTFDCYSKTALM